MQEYTANYQKAGGHKSFADYYTARWNHVLSKSLGAWKDDYGCAGSHCVLWLLYEH